MAESHWKCCDCGADLVGRNKNQKRCKSCYFNFVSASPENNSNFKGGRIIRRGYVYIKTDHPDANAQGYIAEHRLVAEKKIGRRLKRDEHVHHINQIKDDNRPENIEVMHRTLHRSTRHRNFCKLCEKRAHGRGLCVDHYRTLHWNAILRERGPVRSAHCEICNKSVVKRGRPSKFGLIQVCTDCIKRYGFFYGTLTIEKIMQAKNIHDSSVLSMPNGSS